MAIPWSLTPATGSTIDADFLSVDHDRNPGGAFDHPGTVFSKISWDGDQDVRTAGRRVRLAPVMPLASSATVVAPVPTGRPNSTLATQANEPLLEILPQVGGGEAFSFENKGGKVTDQYVGAAECRHSGALGLQLTYMMIGDGTGGWGVHWEKAPLRYFDASEFMALVFWVKGTAGGETFGVGMKDTSDTEVYVRSKDFVVVSASNWEMVIVPLSKFIGVKLNSVENINFSFNQSHGSGSICVDDIAFVITPSSASQPVLQPGASVTLTFASGTPAEQGRQTVSIHVDQPGEYTIVLENANPPYSEHWLRWDYLALKQGDTPIWTIGEDEAPPSYSRDAYAEFCDPRNSSACTSNFIVGSTSAGALAFDLNDGDNRRIAISFMLAERYIDTNLMLVLSTLDSTHPGAADFKMNVILERAAQP
jgi:hypothetical protein